jgi:hypothetical protein
LDRDPRAVCRQDLPYINAEMAELLVGLLVDVARTHGYQLIDKGANGAGAQAHSAPPPPQPTSDEDRAYAEAALDSECKALAALGPGDRNNALNNASLKLHQLVAAGLLTAEEVEARLIEAAKANGSFAEDGEKQVRATIRSGAKVGLTQPRKMPPDPRQHTRLTRRWLCFSAGWCCRASIRSMRCWARLPPTPCRETRSGLA